MFKRFAFCSIGLLVALLFLSCSGGGPRQRFLSIGTAPPGGAFFPVGGALGEVLNASKGDNPWQVNIEATKGTLENIRRLDQGDLDFALANAAITYFAVRGETDKGRQYGMRTVMTLAPNVALFVTRKNSGLRELGDLRGRRVVLGPAGSGFEFFLKPLLAAHGLSYQDITALHNTQSGAVDMLADGAAAAAFLGGAVPTASITQASSSQSIRFIPYGEAEKERLLSTYPFFDPAVIPAGTYRGQDQEFNGLNVGSMHFITSASQDQDLVYQVTKILYENRQKVAERHAAGRAINAGNVVRDTGTEFHAGAIRYYREIGIWPDQASSESAVR